MPFFVMVRSMEPESDQVVEKVEGLQDLVMPDTSGTLDFVETPEAAAQAANAISHTHRVRDKRINELIKDLPETDVADQLLSQMRRSYDAGETMATIGYNNFRMLVASGHTMPEIAESLDVNVLDLAYYMSSHDPNGDNMALDNTLCADSQSEKIYQELDRLSHPTKEEVAVQQLKLQLIEKRNARLSDKWAGIDRNASTLLDGSTSRIVIMMGDAPKASEYIGNPRVINAESNKAKSDQKNLPLNEKGQLVFG